MALRIDYEQPTEKPRLYERIHCFTCAKDVQAKRFLKSHMGHEVHYLTKDGAIDE